MPERRSGILLIAMNRPEAPALTALAASSFGSGDCPRGSLSHPVFKFHRSLAPSSIEQCNRHCMVRGGDCASRLGSISRFD